MASHVTDTESTPLPAWKAMRSALELIGNIPEAVNLIISVGETGEQQENAPSSIVKTLNEKNCRLLGWQLYASNDDKYNNYVLQLSNMIEHYAEYRSGKQFHWQGFTFLRKQETALCHAGIGIVEHEKIRACFPQQVASAKLVGIQNHIPLVFSAVLGVMFNHV